MADRSSQDRRRLVVFAALGLLALALILWVLVHPKPARKPPPHPIPVTAVRVAAEDFELTFSTLGAAQAFTSDMILAQVSGKLIRVNFKEGQAVRAGEVLAEVDPRPYQAALTQAEGALKRDAAALAGARRDLARYQRLVGEGGVSRQILEDQEATVGQDEGTVELDQGEVAAARLNLEFCRIVSPVSGRAGVRLVDPGNLVSAAGSVSSVVSTASSTSSAAAAAATPSNGSASAGPASAGGSAGASGIVVINQIQPIAVSFSVPQGEYQKLQAASDGFRRPLAVEALSQETSAVLGSGVLAVVDNRVDQNTGTVELKATFPNADNALLPGQFVNVRLGVQKLANVVVAPLAAVNRGPTGQFVFVVGPDNRVEMRAVTLAATQGQSAVAASGLKAGDIVVVDGQMTLTKGSLVKVTRLEPAPSPAS